MRTIKIVSKKEYLENSDELMKFSAKLQNQVHIEGNNGKILMILGIGMEPDPNARKRIDDIKKRLKEMEHVSVEDLDTSWIDGIDGVNYERE